MRPMTPAKGKPMPQTHEYWEKRAEQGAFVILEETEMQTDTVGREHIGKVIKIYRTKK
ncbi:MAG: hypothetical protein GY938_11370 [Ketobacter sp.]|nr:hypothetical protein [Ketobacter sp.]